MLPRKCVHIYHYWDHPVLGFGHTRLQTWLPLSVTVCINGRHWLERQLQAESIPYHKDGNCFPHIADTGRARELLDEQLRADYPALLDGLLRTACPTAGELFEPQPLQYYWSADETEWATDILFRCQEDLDRIYHSLLRHGLVAADSPAVMRFFGKKLGGRAPKEILSDHRRRYEGVRLKHWVNRNSVKAYNKAGTILRLETTINNTRDFKVFRHPDDDDRRPASWQKMRKGVSDLHRRAQVSQACNERYADHLAATEVSETHRQVAGDICKRVKKKGRRHRALNPWNEEDYRTLQFLAKGEHNINGFRNRDLRAWLYPSASASRDKAEQRRASGRVTRRLQLLRAHGLIKKAPRTTRYVPTGKGRQVTTAILAASDADSKQLMTMAA
jgi:hypothetical protein